MESTNFPTNNTVPLRVIPFIIPRTRKAFSSKDARLERKKGNQNYQRLLEGGGRSWRESLIRRSGEWLKRHRSLGPFVPLAPILRCINRSRGEVASVYLHYWILFATIIHGITCSLQDCIVNIEAVIVLGSEKLRNLFNNTYRMIGWIFEFESLVRITRGE